MSSRKSGLGKGFGALLDTSSLDSSAGVLQIAVEQISPNPHQPRTKFDQEALKDLSDSIKEHGVIQPLILTKAEEENKYFLIAGERRWQASKLAGLERVPAIIREATQEDMLLLALIENVQRADLNPLETAQAYRDLADNFNLTHQQIADQVGKSRSSVSNTLKLLEAPPDVLQALLDNKISEGHARAIQGLLPQTQNAAVAAVIDYHFSVRQTEELARNLRDLPDRDQLKAIREVIGRLLFLETPEEEETPDKPVKKTDSPPAASRQMSAEMLALQEQLTETIEFKTSIKQDSGGKGGSITITYYNEEDLNTLIEKLLKLS